MRELSKKNRFILSILSGILMVLCFPYTGSLTPLVFISWVPLLMVEHTIAFNRYRSSKLFVHGLITFLIYNLGTTWWVYFASGLGSAMAIVLNSVFMALVFQLFHTTKKYIGTRQGYAALVLYWISFEYIHYHWELSWPWLHLGNVFSITPSWVQWYSLTGVHGGTLWVLLTNLLIFLGLKRNLSNRKVKSSLLMTVFWPVVLILVPIILSLVMYYHYSSSGRNVEMVIIQPNIDPYTEKFDAPVEEQLEKLWNLADKERTKNTALIVAPETAISEAFYEEDAHQMRSVRYLIDRKKETSLDGILIGASTARFFDEEFSRASRPVNGGPGFVEYYNTSMMIDEQNQLSFLHKSLLVPGVEIIPFSDVFPFLEELSIENGGTSGSLGTDKEPGVMKTGDLTVAPMICYESICGEMLAAQCRKGAELVCIITNDGWWRDTPGYKQHMSFARLRAIESRRCIARSANTGISCFIDQRGEIIEQSGWWEPIALRAELRTNEHLTLYARFATVLWKPWVFISCGILIISIYKWFRRRLF